MLATIAEKGAGFRPIADAWADTRTGFMLTVLGGLAEFERDLIRACTDAERGRFSKEVREVLVRFGLTSAPPQAANGRTTVSFDTIGGKQPIV